MFGNKKKVESFDVVTLWLGGMRQTVEWELVMKDGRAEVTLYRIVYGQGKERREPVRRAACDANEALRLLNDKRAHDERAKVQTISVIAPIAILALIGGVVWIVRKKRYEK